MIVDLTKKISHHFKILETYQAGIVLNGQEVKSIKAGRISLEGAFVVFRGNELFLTGANIPPYQPKNAPANYHPQRTRKLLLTKQEIKNLFGKYKQKGLTIKPLSVYTQKGKIKIEFALLKSKKKIDRREEIKKKEWQREKESALKRNLLFNK